MAAQAKSGWNIWRRAGPVGEEGLPNRSCFFPTPCMFLNRQNASGAVTLDFNSVRVFLVDRALTRTRPAQAKGAGMGAGGWDSDWTRIRRRRRQTARGCPGPEAGGRPTDSAKSTRKGLSGPADKAREDGAGRRRTGRNEGRPPGFTCRREDGGARMGGC